MRWHINCHAKYLYDIARLLEQIALGERIIGCMKAGETRRSIEGRTDMELTCGNCGRPAHKGILGAGLYCSPFCRAALVKRAFENVSCSVCNGKIGSEGGVAPGIYLGNSYAVVCGPKCLEEVRRAARENSR